MLRSTRGGAVISPIPMAITLLIIVIQSRPRRVATTTAVCRGVTRTQPLLASRLISPRSQWRRLPQARQRVARASARPRVRRRLVLPSPLRPRLRRDSAAVARSRRAAKRCTTHTRLRGPRRAPCICQPSRYPQKSPLPRLTRARGSTRTSSRATRGLAAITAAAVRSLGRGRALCRARGPDVRPSRIKK